MPGIPDDPAWLQAAMVVSSATKTPNNQREHQMWWNSEGRITLLTERWTEGKVSASQIAEELSDHGRHRVTRSMVIGKAYRLGLPAKVARIHPPNPADRKRRNPAVSRPPKPPKPDLGKEKPSLPRVDCAPLEGVPPVELVDLERYHCRYPVGTSEASNLMLYCGAQRYDDFPYCEHHAAKCYNFAGMRRQ